MVESVCNVMLVRAAAVDAFDLLSSSAARHQLT